MSKEEKPRASFEVYKDAAYKFRWRLVDSDYQAIASGGPYATMEACMEAIEEYRENAIAESGVRAAQEAKADYTWITKWAAHELRPILVPMIRDGTVEANEVIKQKENTLSNKIKRAFWYIVGSVVAIVLGAIALYYIALAGFKICSAFSLRNRE